MRTCARVSLALVTLSILSFMDVPVSAQTVFQEDSLVRQRCIACHNLDENGRMEVIEETRKTPEEWKVVVDRMIAMDGASLDDAEFHPVIRELSKYLCLTPQEMAQVVYINSDENSQYREMPRNELELQIMGACARCHTFGKIKSHRNTPQQWAEIRNLHLGYYPTAVFQMREMDWAKVFEQLLDPLSKLYPYDDPKWHEWMKNRKDQDLTGDWEIAGYQPGFGYYVGTYTFEPNHDKGEDEYSIDREVTYENGTKLKTSGSCTLYSEYHLRYALAPTPLTGRVEGVFDLNADEMEFTGKWWTVVQDSNAFGNEKFCKTDASPKVFACFPRALRAADGVKQKLTLIGVGLPEKLSAADIKFSDPNVRVTEIQKAENSKIVCQVEVKKSVPDGVLNLSVKGIPCSDLLIVFDKVDGIRIFPALGRARVSCGAAYPPQGVQFVARAVNFGVDGTPGTEDDLILEPVDAQWLLEEEPTRPNDDDLKYLQAPIVNGLYMPLTTYGPIKGRLQNQEGVGLIAVVATFADGGRQLKDRALLAVTVTDFVTHIK